MMTEKRPAALPPGVSSCLDRVDLYDDEGPRKLIVTGPTSGS